MKKTISIMLIEDSLPYRKAITRTINRDPSLELISQFASAERALQSLNESAGDTPDILLLDLHLTGMSGIEALPLLKEAIPETKIIVLTQSDKEYDVLAAIQAGASGYLLKVSDLDQIKDAIHSVMNGGAIIDPSVAQFIISRLQTNPTQIIPLSASLSPRELEILHLIADGFLKKEIAHQLNITHRTVATHIENIYQKLNVKNAPSAISTAYKSGLLK